jgi:hypothetical protein
MHPFDHVLILYSFVFALALTHLLSWVGSLMLARRRVRFSGLQAFMAVNAIVLVFVNWLALWFVHDRRNGPAPSVFPRCRSGGWSRSTAR